MRWLQHRGRGHQRAWATVVLLALTILASLHSSDARHFDRSFDDDNDRVRTENIRSYNQMHQKEGKQSGSGAAAANVARAAAAASSAAASDRGERLSQHVRDLESLLAARRAEASNIAAQKAPHRKEGGAGAVEASRSYSSFDVGEGEVEEEFEVPAAQDLKSCRHDLRTTRNAIRAARNASSSSFGSAAGASTTAAEAATAAAAHQQRMKSASPADLAAAEEYLREQLALMEANSVPESPPYDDASNSATAAEEEIKAKSEEALTATQRQKEKEKEEEEAALSMRVQTLNTQLIAARAEVADLQAAAAAAAAVETAAIGAAPSAKAEIVGGITSPPAAATDGSSDSEPGHIPSERHSLQNKSILGQGLLLSSAAAAALILALSAVAAWSNQWRCFQWFRKYTNFSNGSSLSGSSSSISLHEEWPLSLCWPESTSSSSSSSFTFVLVPRCLAIVCTVLALWAVVSATESDKNSSEKNSSITSGSSSSIASSTSGSSTIWPPFIRATAGTRDTLAAHASLLLVTYVVGLTTACVSGAGAIGSGSSTSNNDGGSNSGRSNAASTTALSSLPLCRRRRLLQLSAVGLSVWLAATIEGGNAATRALAQAVTYQHRDNSGKLSSQDGPANKFFGSGGGVAAGRASHRSHSSGSGGLSGDASEDEGWAAALRWILLALGVVTAAFMELKSLPPLPPLQELNARSIHFTRGGEGSGMGSVGGGGSGGGSGGLLEDVKEGGDSCSDGEGSSNSGSRSGISGVGLSALSFDSASSGSSAPLRFRRASSMNEGNDDGRPIGGSFDRNV